MDLSIFKNFVDGIFASIEDSVSKSTNPLVALAIVSALKLINQYIDANVLKATATSLAAQGFKLSQ